MRKLTQKEYKTRQDWVGKMTHWELCKKFKFDHTNKWYMHNPASVLDNETHKLLWDFDIQTNYLISTRRLSLIIIIVFTVVWYQIFLSDATTGYLYHSQDTQEGLFVSLSNSGMLCVSGNDALKTGWNQIPHLIKSLLVAQLFYPTFLNDCFCFIFLACCLPIKALCNGQ